MLKSISFKSKNSYGVNRMKKEKVESECKGETGTSLMGYSRDLFKKYDYKCVYCGKYFGGSFEDWMQLTREHVIPYKKLTNEDAKYKDYENNLRVACAICNNMRTRADFSEYDSLQIDERIERVLVAKKELILKRREEFERFYEMCVKGK